MMIDFNIILAKSEPKNQHDEFPVTLEEHINDGLKVWNALQKSFPHAPKLAKIENFWELLKLCIIFHDLGKAHQEFQKILRGIKNNEWCGQRHELFSLPFLEELKIGEEEKQWMRLVVAGHHRDYNILWDKYISENYKEENDWSDFDPFNDDTSFDAEFELVNQKAVLELLKTAYKISINEVKSIPPNQLILNYLKDKYTFEKPDYFTLFLMFGAFKHCDHLSSAFIEELENLEQPNFNFLHNQDYDLYEHQEKAFQTLGNLVLTAPTGSGKTETALLWLQNQLKHTGQGRVFYILPFTASINAMFERLENENEGFGKGKIGMLHGKLSSYLYDYFEDYQYGTFERKEKIKSIKAKFKTIETPLKIITPFQLLKHLFGLKGFEKGIFEFAGAHFIFDEIHAYNAGVFAQIVVLLEYVTQNLGAKVMIMTATFPSFMKSILKKAIGDSIEIKASDKLYSNFDRHQVIIKEGLLSEDLDEIKNKLSEVNKITKKKNTILIVCNTVKSAQSVYGVLKDTVEKSVLLHSSFCGRDRTELEKRLMNDEPQLLVGTQAIEVSLDIDYDMIYTEHAPFDALIQRFGRVNRKRKKEIAPCFVFSERNESDEYIYSDEIIEDTLRVLKTIEIKDNGVIKEKKLQQYIDQVYKEFKSSEKEDYEKTYQYLKDSVNRLSPFIHSKESEEDFYKQFDGVKVLPVELEKEYRKLLEKEFNFIAAESLKVQISKRWFGSLFGTPILEKCRIVFTHPNNPDSKEIEIEYFRLNKKYEDLQHQGTGLLINEDKFIFDEGTILG
jgi:CRISPR-associated endonuclease/helicase Cas3